MTQHQGSEGPEGQQDQEEHQELLPLDQFLTNVAPGAWRLVEAECLNFSGGPGFALKWPSTLRLYCHADACQGERIFELDQRAFTTVSQPGRSVGIQKYKCKNCERGTKEYSLIGGALAKKPLLLFKLGEFPRFGAPLPQQLLDLAGDDADYLTKGHSAEAQGLGIGAFAYYRRFVDLQKNRLFQRIIQLAELNAGYEELIDELREAKKAQRFKDSMKAISHALPPALLIRNDNPLSLLYNALSANLHGKSDEECLELATAVRAVLAGLVERLDFALADDQGLRSAMTKLANAASKKNNAKETA
jgi:hypothetical protein